MSRLAPTALAAVLAALAVTAPALAQTDAAAPAELSVAEQCAQIAGAPSAEVPISADAQKAMFARLAEARSACEAAATEGDGAALFHIATIAQARGRHDEALDLYGQAAEAGIAAAHSRIGDYYNFGIGRTRPDVEKALASYRAGIEQGDPAAQTTLGMMHVLGRGVSRDSDRAIALLGEAADSGYHFAQARLAALLLETRASDAASVTRARTLLASAAGQGSLDALSQLPDLFARDLPGLPPSPFQRFYWTARAVDAGLPDALAARGLLHEFGIGTTVNPERAADDYIAALETGEVDADTLRRGPDGNTPRWTRETALAFQRILQDRGLYRGPLDAIVGGGTMAAARAVANN
ncbi:tetratricopeptide repeat protein [Anianabacter salinae]|uniref:tetratricopeptide repeat protein n=1 Tax=Anianabacter salinae TaxID=2851023 RepID=UPI00225E4262|nr:tetratricopeptide repeat protein [Anianabacter salinae]MBV0911802.1 sel1 repeat family protein [Anianabacter salinae]